MFLVPFTQPYDINFRKKKRGGKRKRGTFTAHAFERCDEVARNSVRMHVDRVCCVVALLLHWRRDDGHHELTTEFLFHLPGGTKHVYERARVRQ